MKGCQSLVVEGLPSSFKVHEVEEFFNAVVDLYQLEGQILNVAASKCKVFAFLTVTSKNTAYKLMCKNLLYCGSDGSAYPIRIRPFYPAKKTEKQSKNQPPKVVTILPEKQSKCVLDHVNFTPDYSMALNPAVKKKKRRKNEDIVWFGGLGSVKRHSQFRKKTVKKKQRKSVCLAKLAGKSETFPFGLNVLPEKEVCNPNNKVSERESETKVLEHIEEQSKIDVGQKKRKEEWLKVEEQVSKKTTGWQAFVEHSYIGPLCLQAQPETTVAEIKLEIEQRCGLPSARQILSCRNVKVNDSDSLRNLAEMNCKEVCFTLNTGALKGGAPPVQPEEGAVGGRDVSTLSSPADHMFTWGIDKVCEWLEEIEIDTKYRTRCRAEEIDGRALLCLSKNSEKLKLALNMKAGPLQILQDAISIYINDYDKHIHSEQKWRESGPISSWKTRQLVNWLEGIGLQEKYLTLCKEEEINGKAFEIICRDQSNLKNTLSLKEGPLALLLEYVQLYNASLDKVHTKDEPAQSMNVRDTESNKEPGTASDQHISIQTPVQSAFLRAGTKPKEEKLAEILSEKLQIDFYCKEDKAEVEECIARLMYFQTGASGNPLENVFQFVVLCKGKGLCKDLSRKLWRSITHCALDFMTLLTSKDLSKFIVVENAIYSKENPAKVLKIRDGKSITQVNLEKIATKPELKDAHFILLVDACMVSGSKKTFRFHGGKKFPPIYFSMCNKDPFIATFDTNKIDAGLQWSKWFLEHKKMTAEISSGHSDSRKRHDIVADTHEDPSVGEKIVFLENPREFDTDDGKKTYRQPSILTCIESGPKDLLRPMHEFKLFINAVSLGPQFYIWKFIYETLRFACTCLNERSNGTIHFGIADQDNLKSEGYQPCEVVGVPLSNQAIFDDKLKEFVGKCFEDHSIVRNCIRPPIFVPVKSTKTKSSTSRTCRSVIEVDIVPRFSFCRGEIFKVALPSLEPENQSKKQLFVAYVRDGAHSRQLQDKEMEEMLKKRLPKLDKERSRLEQYEQEILKLRSKEESNKYLFTKLQRLLCAGNKVLDCSVYPVLVLTKPDEEMCETYLNQHFQFISNVNWQVIIDFDDEGSKESNLCRIFTDIRANTNTSPICSIHEAEDFDSDDKITEYLGSQTCWIFANGYTKLGRKADDFIPWRNSKRKRGITEVIKLLSTEIPKTRIVVLFVLLSKAYEAAADIFAEFCTYLDGPNQLLYVAEDYDVASSWKTQLCRTCVEESIVDERGVVGMSWGEFQGAVLEMVTGLDLEKAYVPMSSGGLCELRGDHFTNISILSATECAQLENLNLEETKLISYNEQINFYGGKPVSWKNFWFTDQGENHVLKRDKYDEFKDIIEQSLKGLSNQRVQTVNLFYQVGAGASTLARHVLWDLRNDMRANFRCRCVVVNQVTDDTCTEIFRLRRIGYSSEEPLSPPVLALIENVDDILFKELRSQVIDRSVSIPSTVRPVCVFIYCRAITNPYEYSRRQSNLSVCLEQRLSKREVKWFKNKFQEMEGKFKEHEKEYNPEYDFNKFASDNLISFMLMKENFNPQYAKNVVKRNLDDMPSFELNMLTNLSLLNVHDPHEVFAACFDSIMLSDGMRKKNLFRNWMNDLSASARVFLKEIDRSEDYGTGKAIAIAHPIIASEILDEVAQRRNASVGDIALSFLQSDLFREQAKYSFPLKRLRETTIIMLKHRKKYEYGDDEQTKFSPLIEKILYSTPTSKQATEESIFKAAEVLKEGLEKFNDPIIAQQIARVFYVNAIQFANQKPYAESCFENASVYGKKALEMNPGNSFILDTMGRIFESKIKLLFGHILEENKPLGIDDTVPLLKFTSEAVRWFQESQEAGKEDQNVENKSGVFGELSVIFYLLDVLRCVDLFRKQEGMELLRRYLTETEFVPKEVAEVWKEFHLFMKAIEERYFSCMEELIEEFSIFKENTEESRSLPRRIARFKFQYLNYFGKECFPAQLSAEPQSWKYRWEYRWQKINQYLAGDLFYSIFNIVRAETNQNVTDPREILQKLRSLVEENFAEQFYEHTYKDLLLMITLSLSLHSPYSPHKFALNKVLTAKDTARLAEEYKEIYQLVEALSVLEMKKPETGKRIYGRFFKVLFLWPREEMELGENYKPQEFYEALQQLKNDFGLKTKKSSTNVDKWLKQNVHKKMTFKERERQYTTLFYLGKGRGLDAFVHKNELPHDQSGKPPITVKWNDPYTRNRLQRWNGTIESKKSIAVKNPLDSGRQISLYYAGGHQRQFSKEEVSFFIGFSWAGPIALDVRFYRNELVMEQVVIFRDDFQLYEDLKPFIKPKAPYGNEIRTYDEYVAEFRRVGRKLREIHHLKRKGRVQQLDKIEKEKLSKEKDYEQRLVNLKLQYLDFEDID